MWFPTFPFTVSKIYIPIICISHFTMEHIHLIQIFPDSTNIRWEDTMATESDLQCCGKQWICVFLIFPILSRYFSLNKKSLFSIFMNKPSLKSQFLIFFQSTGIIWRNPKFSLFCVFRYMERIILIFSKFRMLERKMGKIQNFHSPMSWCEHPKNQNFSNYWGYSSAWQEDQQCSSTYFECQCRWPYPRVPFLFQNLRGEREPVQSGTSYCPKDPKEFRFFHFLLY